jgi:hypothetical protein
MKLFWKKLRTCARTSSTLGDINIKILQRFVIESVNENTLKDWQGYCNYVEKLEQE